MISANPGDTDPRLFEVGDTYDVSFGGTGGATLEDAVVLRSDSAPGGGGIIVFSGTDQNGDATQVVWTPDFELNGWYWDHYHPWAEPGFYNTDTNGSYAHTFVCFAAQTRIRVPGGTTMAGDLRAGDDVWTLDQGPMPLIWSGQCHQPGRGSGAPVLFKTGSIGNNAPLRLSQQHRVLVHSARAEIMFGAPEVFVPAKAMINGRDIQLIPCPTITYVHLLLASHQVLTADGALCESLLYSDMVADLALPETDKAIPNGATYAARLVLTYAEACALLAAPRTKGMTKPNAIGQRLHRREFALV
ncbi:MAG: hypothetical protein ACI8R4_000010 [Paracoccaceae bacterium]